MDGLFTIHRFPRETSLPPLEERLTLFSITQTAEELSIVCDSWSAISGTDQEPGWRALKVVGPLDFALIGILAGISGALGKAGISIFAISTFDTDYILVKEKRLDDAVQALKEAGYPF